MDSEKKNIGKIAFAMPNWRANELDFSVENNDKTEFSGKFITLMRVDIGEKNWTQLYAS